jgi:UDP-glucose 4-epimerase
MILVTGAAGFLGRFLCAHLRSEQLAHAGIDRDTCDIRDASAVAKVFHTHRIDSVIHLAAVLPSTAQLDPAHATSVNIQGSLHLLEAAARSGVRRFVFGSSGSVYGAARASQPLTEEDRPAPTDIYGAAKRYVEMCGAIMGKTHGFQFVSLRLAIVVGPDSRSVTSPWRSEIFERLGTGARHRITLPFGADAVLSMIHVEDVARILVLLATQGSQEMVYNSPSENWTAQSLKDFVENLDRNITVELLPGDRIAAAIADGTKFVRDFMYQAPSLADRLTASWDNRRSP